MNRDDSIKNYCPGCGGNFAGNAGYCDCGIGRQIQSLLARNKQLREFVRFVKAQLGTGPRTNGIDQKFCFEIGEKAKVALGPVKRSRQ